ncbi:MAG: HAD family hydrolase [Opitutaceae bacterium]|nr:HAD family hydrolase [Opitutaceae bacterium]
MHAVIFDLDQTLYPEADFVRSGFRAVAAHLAERCGGQASALAEEMESILWQEGRGSVFDLLYSRHGWGARVAPETLLHLYRTHVPELRLHADAADLLGHLRVPLGLVTDGHPTTQHRKIAALGLESRFAAIVCTGDLGVHAAKPAATGFRVCLERLGVDPEQAAYVGDDAAKDFSGPRALGMRTVRVARTIETGFGWFTAGETTEADLVVEDLREAKEFLT